MQFARVSAGADEAFADVSVVGSGCAGGCSQRPSIRKPDLAPGERTGSVISLFLRPCIARFPSDSKRLRDHQYDNRDNREAGYLVEHPPGPRIADARIPAELACLSRQKAMKTGERQHKY